MIIDAPKRAEIPALRALWKEAFGDTDAWLDTFFSTAFSPTRSRVLTEEGSVAAALYWFDCEAHGAPVAYLYAIATAKAMRGKGLCRALMENTHQYLRSLGYASAVLVPAEHSLFDFYGKMGYRPFSPVKRLTVKPSGDPVAIRRLTQEEYASRRRALLPTGGVVQEKESLAFLSTQAALCAAADALFTARMENGVLYVSELLGSVAIAPRLTRTFGAKEGHFRTCGEGDMLAMYYPLLEDAPAPTYFGLPFD